MATRRTIHKKIVLCEQLADVSDLAKLAFTWGILHADDWGVVKATPRGFKAEVLPLHDASVDEIQCALDELVNVKLVVRYTYNDITYIWFPTFDEYQDGIHKRTTKSQLPGPFEADEGSIENEHLLIKGTSTASENFREIPGNSGKIQETAGNSETFLETAGNSGDFPEIPKNSRPNETKRNEENRNESKGLARAKLAPPEISTKLSTNDQKPPPHVAFAEKLWTEFRQALPCPKPVVTAAGQFLKSHGQRGADLLLVAFASTNDGLLVPEGADPATHIADRVRTAIRRDFEWDPNKQRGQPQRITPTTTPPEKMTTGRVKI